MIKQNATISFPKFTAVIFDMDGLVLDTEGTYFIAWQKAVQAMGYDISDDFCLTLSGLHYQAVEQQILAYCGESFDLQEFTRLSSIYWRDIVWQQGIVVKKGFFQLLSVLQKQQIPYCLATNSHKINAQECLQFSGLETTFPLIVSRDCVDHGKPSPEIFFKAAKLLDVSMSECLILEDSATGIAAAYQTPARSVYIPSVVPADQTAVEQADFVFEDLQAVAEIIMF